MAEGYRVGESVLMCSPHTMTYKELLEELKTLTDEQLNGDVVVHLTGVDEFVPVHGVCVAVDDECDVLDQGHIVLVNGHPERTPLMTRPTEKKKVRNRSGKYPLGIGERKGK